MLTLLSGVLPGTLARNGAIVGDRTAASVVAVLLTSPGGQFAALAGPQRRTGALAFVVDDVARAPVVAIARADVMLTVRAVVEGVALAPWTTSLDDAHPVVAGQVAANRRGLLAARDLAGGVFFRVLTGSVRTETATAKGVLG